MKNIFSGLGHFFKSNFGSVLLKAAAVYVGGAAAGLWDSPFESINGAFTSGANAASTGTDAAVQNETQQELTGETQTTPLPAQQAAAPSQLPPSAPQAPEVAQGAQPAASPTPSSPGILDNLWSGYKSMSGPAQAALISTGGAALKGAFTPNASQLLDKQAQLARDNMAWRNAFLAPNYSVGNVNVGTPNPSPQPLTDTSGKPVYPVVKPRGILNNAMR